MSAVRLAIHSALPVPALVVVVIVALGGGCGPRPNPDVCTLDSECGEFRTCDVATGECLCVNDLACDNGTCNSAGRCQPRSGCLTNLECDSGPEFTGCAKEYCDVAANQCKSVCFCDPDEGQTCCSIDSQCPFGQVCNSLDFVCVPGCRDDGDCRLGEGCVKEGIVALGQCAAGVCTANNLCDYGEICDIAQAECVFDTRGPYCYSCTGGVASDDCGTPGNYCLLDATDPTGQSSFCGVDCSQNQACPFGYECHEVIILPQTLPTCRPPEVCLKDVGEAVGVCSRTPGFDCVEDEECPEGPPGSDCPRWSSDTQAGGLLGCEPGVMCPGGSECPAFGECPPFGHCLVDQRPCEKDLDCCDDPNVCPPDSCVFQQCVGGEGDAYGHCTCTIDADCPRDACDGADLTDPANPVFGHCELAGHACLEDIDCDVIACVDGGCRIGANCAPANDRSCREVLSQD